MDVTKVIHDLFDCIRKYDSKFVVPEYTVNAAVSELETVYTPVILKVLQKDETFFSEPRMFCGVNLSEYINDTTRDDIWKNLQAAIFASFLHGDLKEKLGKILDTVKGIWNSSGQENSEISRILNDENSEGHLQKLIAFLSETRIAKLCMKLFEEIDFEDMASELNIDNPNDVIEMMKNPEHPVIKRIINRIQGTLQQKLQRGEFSQHQIVSEIESIKAKIQSLFGNMFFNDMLGGRRAEVPATVLTGNTPEARRQRMISRLQKKQREKNSQ